MPTGARLVIITHGVVLIFAITLLIRTRELQLSEELERAAALVTGLQRENEEGILRENRARQEVWVWYSQYYYVVYVLMLI